MGNNDARANAISAEAKRELARRCLLDFAECVIPRFKTPAHIRHIAALLEELESGKRRRLAICVPVRHGKSVLTSQAFTGWYLGRHPDRNVILVSHSEDSAVRNSRVAKNFIEDSRWPFDDVSLAADSTSAGRWNLKQGGGCYAVGVGGAITGRGADLLLIDDALHDGLSDTEKASTFRWYSEVAIPRLEPGGAVVVIGARFAGDDLIGQILDSEDGPNWEGNIVNLAAIAGEDDPLGRKVGEALWPERYGLDELEARRVSMSSRAFEAQFQQNPIPAEGALIKASWFKRYDRLPESFEKITMALDSASKTGISNDYSAIVVLGSTKSEHFIIDVIRERVEFPGLIRMVVNAYDKHNPSKIIVEDTSNAVALIQTLKSDSHLPIVPVRAIGSKIARVEGITGLLESGVVVFPNEAPWLLEFERELLSFNGSGKGHDDQVDALEMALSAVKKKRFSYAASFGGDERTYYPDAPMSIADRMRGLY